MNIELRSIADKGSLQKERLTFRIGANLDLGDYIVLQSGFLDDAITTDIHHTFWFNYKTVEKGDLIILYTRRGREFSRPLKESGTAHFLYWGLSDPIWDDASKAAVLLEAPRWNSKSSRALWKA